MRCQHHQSRAGQDNPLAELAARQALNLVVDRQRLFKEALAGYGEPSAGLTPSWTLSYFSRLTPYAHDPKKAVNLWRELGWQTERQLKLASAREHEPLARLVAQDIHDALQVGVELNVCTDAEKLAALRRLAERQGVPDWDIFIYGWSGQTTDAPPLELHYQFLGARGAWRAGETLPHP